METTLKRAMKFVYAAVLLAASAFVAVPAFAGTDSEAVALGFQTEHADLVVVARAKSGLAGVTKDTTRAKVEYAVDSVIRGDAPERLVVELERSVLAGLGDAPETHLLFLASPKDGGHHRPYLGPRSVYPLPETGAAARVQDVVAQYAAALGAPETERSTALCATLVAQMEDANPGIVWSGATDFYRRGELAETISREYARRIVDAFERLSGDGRAKGALAMAVARCGDPGAAESLAKAVDSDAGETLRGAFGDAAEILGTEELAKKLEQRLSTAPAARRRGLISVLGRVGTESAGETLLPFLRDKDAAVRQEAFHAAGNVARNVRWIARRKRTLAARAGVRPDPEPKDDSPTPDTPAHPAERPKAEPDVSAVIPAAPTVWERVRTRLRVELSRAALAARTSNDKRGSLWALAQLDDPAAFAFLRRLEDTSRDPEVQRLTKAYRERPVQSLILR